MLMHSTQNSDVHTKTARHKRQVRGETKIKVKGAGGETGGLSLDLASGQSRCAGRQSNGQVQQPNRQKEEKCLRRTTARLSKATHSY